jgi:signal transduction histidine kinase
MSHASATARPSSADRVERIFKQFDTLPTLGAVAIRLLQLTTDETAEAKEVIRLVASDPALASKVLGLCRCRDRTRAGTVTTIDRAVLLLGFEAVRCAVLSAEVFEAIDGLLSPAGEAAPARSVFDREAFWLHALGVAVASEKIASLARGPNAGVVPGEAFMAGLLHDIGQLVLHVLLPESYDRVCQLAERHGASLDRICRQIIGIDTHTTGKRLAEQWGLSPALVDVIWLCGQPFTALPTVPHRNLIATVSLADELVRERYITPTAHGTGTENASVLLERVGIAPADAERVVKDLHEEVGERAEALGLNVASEPAILLRALTRANASLVRASDGMRRRDRNTQRQSRALRAVCKFHDALPPGSSTHDVVAEIARSAADLLEASVAAALYRAHGGEVWHVTFFTPEGEAWGDRSLDATLDAVSPSALIDDMRAGAPALPLMPWLSDLFIERAAPTELCTLPLATPGRSGCAVLLIEAPRLDDLEAIEGIVRCWEGALAAGAQHDSIARLAEELAQANRSLLETQMALARSQTMATLGEVAAGAAHEMNNPLMVISGRSQLLARRLDDPDAKEMAREIDEQTHRLSDMITALRSFAEPLAPKARPVDLTDLVLRAVQRFGAADGRQTVDTVFSEGLPVAMLDDELIGGALDELLANSSESKGTEHIELRVQTGPLDGRLRIEVRDDGAGLTEHAQRHAFDPFFSAKPAGRQPGLGLARARRAIEAHGGELTLVNAPGSGAVATIWLRDWRQEEDLPGAAASEAEREE